MHIREMRQIKEIVEYQTVSAFHMGVATDCQPVGIVTTESEVRCRGPVGVLGIFGVAHPYQYPALSFDDREPADAGP